MTERTFTASIRCPNCSQLFPLGSQTCSFCGYTTSAPEAPPACRSLPDMDYNWVYAGKHAVVDGVFTADELRMLASAIEGESDSAAADSGDGGQP